MMGWCGTGGHMSAAGWLVIALPSVLLIAALVVIAYLIVGATRHPTADGAARRVLDERFARGELDAEEYQRRRTLLDGGQGS